MSHSRAFRRSLAVVTPLLVAAALAAHADGAADRQRNFAGSVQLDYLAVPTERNARDLALDGATVELSLKMTQDFGHDVTSSVKMCVACHGLEVGMAFFDLRVNDELNFRVGRFTPAFGEFPLRHDPANHRTSDKPLPYDMGRMLHLQEFNLGVLPAPWVDNGLEINGTHFFDEIVQVDYAAYAVGGPRAAADSLDFDYKQSRSSENYYVDNNSRPVLGGHLAWSIIGEHASFQLGGSAMTGTYDDANQLRFVLLGAQAILHIEKAVVRAEYLVRRTEMATGGDPATRFRYGPGADGRFDPYFLKEGFYTEAEIPIQRFDLVARWDGLRRRGNVAKMSELRSDTGLLRYTLGASFLLRESLRLKLSGEFYDFSDFGDEKVVHLGIAGPF